MVSEFDQGRTPMMDGLNGYPGPESKGSLGLREGMTMLIKKLIRAVML